MEGAKKSDTPKEPEQLTSDSKNVKLFPDFYLSASVPPLELTEAISLILQPYQNMPLTPESVFSAQNKLNHLLDQFIDSKKHGTFLDKHNVSVDISLVGKLAAKVTLKF